MTLYLEVRQYNECIVTKAYAWRCDQNRCSQRWTQLALLVPSHSVRQRTEWQRQFEQAGKVMLDFVRTLRKRIMLGRLRAHAKGPSPSNFRLGSEFDAFLFASVGEDRNGLPLSIISLLGRMDLDPWQEAASLAGLPGEAAVQKLASLLAALPVPSLNQADPETIATRLIALLPRRTDPQARGPGTLRVGATVHPRIVMHAILFAIWLIWLLGITAVSARHDVATHAETHAQAPLTMPSQTPPMASGKYSSQQKRSAYP
jgi:hypothetical protein